MSHSGITRGIVVLLLDAYQRDVVIRWQVILSVMPVAPNREGEQWEDKPCPSKGLTECQPTSHGKLEDQESKDHAVDNDWPRLSG